MSGSRKWMVYQDDLGVDYLTEIDESNGEAAGFADCTVDNQTLPILPSRFQMRYVNVVRAGASGEDIRRKIKVGTLDALQDLITSRIITLADGAYNVRSSRGEKRTFPIPIDTAINDGDIT